MHVPLSVEVDSILRNAVVVEEEVDAAHAEHTTTETDTKERDGDTESQSVAISVDEGTTLVRGGHPIESRQATQPRTGARQRPARAAETA